MTDIDFDNLQKVALDKFLQHNPNIKDKEVLSDLLDTVSKLITTTLYEYHKRLQNCSE